MNPVKIKRHTARAVGMLNCIINNKWKKEDKKTNMMAAISLAQIYIERLKEEINNLPDRS